MDTWGTSFPGPGLVAWGVDGGDDGDFRRAFRSRLVVMRGWWWGLAGLWVVLSGCYATTPPSPVRIASGPPLAWKERPGHRIARSFGELYEVHPGDTLWAIAMVHEVDVEELANWNQIQNPDLLYVGQRLKLNKVARPAGKLDRPALETAAGEERPPPQVAAVAAVAAKGEQDPEGGAARREGKAAATPPPVAAAGSQQALVRPRDRLPPASSFAVPEERPSGWKWPVLGTVVARFDNTGGRRNSGIDIAAAVGTPVLAAASGVVVYADSGLPGYGNLVILRHGGSFMSAYAHNETLLVEQGQKVRAGQEIARVGNTGRVASPRLHFEIRQGIRPVDPLHYLPAQ